MSQTSSVLLIYTGGTIGMVQDAATNALIPFNFNHLNNQIPELQRLNVKLSSISFDPPIDSSDMHPSIWIKLAALIEQHYDTYDGFVILHGSDTMAYTASALSFMLENVNKPIIFTGSQLPIGVIRTDGKENLITAIEIAAAKKKGQSIVPEVAIYFEYKLYRGNRTHKFNAEYFDAFQSPNYPILAEAGVNIHYHYEAIRQAENKPLQATKQLDHHIAILKLFPGILPETVNAILATEGLKAIVLETFGAGNAPSVQWFLDSLENAIQKGIIIYNVTQCNAGSVIQGKYSTSKGLERIGVIGGRDITTEAAVAKLMYLLGKGYTKAQVKQLLQTPLCGEMTE